VKKTSLKKSSSAPKKRGRPPKVQTSEVIVVTNAKPTVGSSVKLQAAMAALNEKYGKATVMLADSDNSNDVDRIPTGNYIIDEATGGGIPRGRITEIYGNESSGKTTLACQLIKQAQDMGLTAALIDVEQSIGFDYLIKMGIDLSRLIFAQPSSAEEALEIAEVLMKSGDVALIILDSVAAMATKREIAGEVADEHVAELPRLMSKELKKSISIIKKSNTAVVLINQLRDKIGTFGHGDKESTPGGRAIKFYASLRIKITRIENIYKTVGGDKLVIGQLNQLETVKNKVGPAKRKVRTELRYAFVFPNGEMQTPGYDALLNLMDELIEKRIVWKKAQVYTMVDGSKITGKDDLRLFLLDTNNQKQYVELLKAA
jgi:recombination protein RecA